jgi:isoleucyl-tRNA synthetase
VPPAVSEPRATAEQEFSFVAAEHAVLEFWAREKVFERSVERNRNRRPYIFYDGPPFATGLPHHGHLVASTIKDVVPRYWTMAGRHVIRRFGWDCHGLPIEHEIDKQFGASAQDIVAQLGVAGYNDACRAIVTRYVKEWRQTITRLGRWVDFDHDYKTMDVDYMESVWWVFRQLWDRGRIYQGRKVMPVSTALQTPLANFEATQNYVEVQDPALTVLLALEDEPASLAVWTTTPWTLPANLLVCVHAGLDYVRVHDAERDVAFYVAAARLPALAKRRPLTVTAELKGAALVGRRYRPLFPWFAGQRAQGAFQVVADDYVTADDGTGLVHLAPAFGEDDFRVARAAGLDVFACPVGMDGRFTAEVPPLSGLYIKDADRQVIRALRDSGALYEHDTVVHNYPYCYRSDTPLIYRAVPAWFVRVAGHVDELLAANAQVHWVPEHIKEGRFGNFLRGAIDWCISRNRVWGTPLPVWINDETGDALCVGSRAELAELTGVHVDDLHREHVDGLEIRRPGQPGTWRRIPEVLDCWFESGSMPYAQLHYPFENEATFRAGFPAEFVAEGLDQTRGWFYNLLVLSTALYGKPAFRNVIVNGIVAAEDGRKMSKRLRNYTAPDELMERFGADALRLYLVTSGVTRGEEMRFSDDGVRDMVRRALLPWYNAFNFLVTYADIDGWSPEKSLFHGDDVLDRWILSRLQTLKALVEREMRAYRLYTVVPALFDFIEDLTNWYIRLNRARFWEDGVGEPKLAAYSALYTAIEELGRVMAPFAPFLSEHVYQRLARLGGGAPQGPVSVHLCDYPRPQQAAMLPALEAAVARMQQVVLLGRQKRDEAKVNLRTPLPRVTIVHRDRALLDGLRELEGCIARELNVKEVAYSDDEAAYITLFAKPNFPLLGKRFGRRMKDVQRRIAAMTPAEIATLTEHGSVELDGERFGDDEIVVLREVAAGSNVVSNRHISIDLDCRVSEPLRREGLAREVVNRIQRARKDAGLHVADRIDVVTETDPELAGIVAEHAAYIAGETLARSLAAGVAGDGAVEARVGEHVLRFALRVAS